MTKPFYQGKLDGLCGPYAIVNAFERCGVDNAEALFEAACSAPAKTRWPGLLWEGTTLGDLTRMIKRCREMAAGAEHVEISYPFKRNTPRTNDVYWKKLHELFNDRPDMV